MFRVVVQDSRVTPTSGKVVAFLGSYDPHAKTAVLDKEKAATFLKNGAQPSDRAPAARHALALTFAVALPFAPFDAVASAPAGRSDGEAREPSPRPRGEGLSQMRQAAPVAGTNFSARPLLQ